jgi:hypothetical protein
MKAMIFSILIVAIAMLGIPTLPAMALAAQQQCADAAQLLIQLQAKYAEVPLFVGTVSPGQTVIVTANPDGSTWTALIKAENGNACIGSAGVSWRAGEPEPTGQEG